MSEDSNRFQIESLESMLYLSDLDLVRVIEDLTEILIAKGHINLDEFSESTKDKLVYRKKIRAQLSQLKKMI